MQPFQSCLALAVRFSIVVLELFSSSSSPSRMKKPPAGLGGLSALSGWVLTVYLHKYLSPSYAACLCDSLELFIFPPAATLVAAAPRGMPGQMPQPQGTAGCLARLGQELTLPGSPAPPALRDQLGN